jgi:hypothetical protein
MQSSTPNITVDSSTRFIVNNNGESVPYNNRNMSSPHDAFKAVVDVLNAHSADMFHVILRVISNKYGHSFDDMLDTITSSNEYANLQTNPLLQSLSYFDQSDLNNITHSTFTHDDTDSLTHSIHNMNISDTTSDTIPDTSDTIPIIPDVLITKKRKPKTTSATPTSAIIPLAIPPPETITIRKKGKKSTQ